MQRPMFKDYKNEAEAYQAVEKMKKKYDRSCINVIVPFPKRKQTKASMDYDLPEENVTYDKDEFHIDKSLEGCGFNTTQSNILKETIKKGQVLVVICKDS
ncbi:hypothetical protein ACE1TH_12330 [Shouchella sp. JSM 1781072]|uniref:hypothetical protein n=1 Tax=Bacillaceae TaxID=186817 RepID=UPI000C08C3E3|nr:MULTISPECIES: hypothetical protein [Bacillaceae]UTR06877.1 hypothetical protein MM326_02270 [Alkalihalobacillus sp. LMS6]